MNKKINLLKHALYRDSGFVFDNTADLSEAFAQEALHLAEPDLYIYSRYRNPTLVACETKLAEMENAAWALLTSSGMAAIDVALGILQHGNKPNKWLFLSEIYGGTHSYIDKILIARRGIDALRFAATPMPQTAVAKEQAPNLQYDLIALEALLQKEQPSVLYFEAVSNPMLIVSDAKAIIALGKKYNCTVIADNTFATPYLWKPLADGADLVIHSATKYLSGHGDLTAGVLCGNNNLLLQQAIEYRKWVGNNLSPDDAYRLHSQLDTFELRFSKHCSNALALAQFFAHNEKIQTVIYPGLPTDASYQNATQLFEGKGYGGMITIILKTQTAPQALDILVKELNNKIPIVPSLGDTRTTLLPIKAVWGAKYPIDGAVRISVGIENTETLIHTFSDALHQI